MMLFPRLPSSEARPLVSRYVRASLEELRRESALAHEKMIFGATGGFRIREDRLESLRSQVRAVATSQGYPNIGGPAARTSFDLECSLLFARELSLSPNEASQGGVWQFLSVVLLPDITRWRFFQESEAGTNAERFLGGSRNVFRRLWWRVHILGGTEDAVRRYIADLGEDELTQVFERTSLAGYPLLARALLDEAMRLFPGHLISKRGLLLRDAPKRLVRLQPFVSFEMLSSEELKLLLVDTLAKSVSALKLND